MLFGIVMFSNAVDLGLVNGVVCVSLILLCMVCLIVVVGIHLGFVCLLILVI